MGICPSGIGVKPVGILLILGGLGGVGLGFKNDSVQQKGLGIVGIIVGIVLLFC